MPDAFRIRPDIRAQTGTDQRIADLARRQHGIVSREQLVALGLGRRAIAHRLETGRLHLLHRGIYAVGHPLVSQDGRWMAAALAAGGVVSHRAAGTAWEICAFPLLEVTASRSRRRPGIRIYRSRLEPDETTRLRGIPVTTPARTVFDLAATLPTRQVERALNEAELRRLVRRSSLLQLIERYPRRAGTPALKAILQAGEGVTRSEFESRFAEFAAVWRFPIPERNVRIRAGRQWFECDFVWRRERLIVELDGRAFHGTPAAFERDRARDRRLIAAGWRVIRVTWRQLHAEPEALAADLCAALSKGR